MRLSEEHKRAIHDEVRATFGPDAVVRLFGSRVDDSLHGGDIDLHIEADGNPSKLLDGELKLHARLLRRLGDRRIDIVVHDGNSPRRRIDEHAVQTGVTL